MAPESKKPPNDLMATMIDGKGRTVWLTKERWGHIADEHSELGTRLDEVKKAVEMADKRTRGNRPGTEKLWASGPGPSKWLSVVVAYEGRVGRIRTAIPSKKGPREQELI